MNNNQMIVMPAEQLREMIAQVIQEHAAALQAAPVVHDEWPELMDRAQAAEFLKVCRASIDNWSRAGLLKKHYVGRRPRFKRDELRQVFDSWKQGRG